jgi:small subunit ribosomal protein S16
VGKKKQPMYRIVVADSRARVTAPSSKRSATTTRSTTHRRSSLNEERAKHWLDHGAQPSDRVAKLLKIQGVAEIPAKLATRMALGEQRQGRAG